MPDPATTAPSDADDGDLVLPVLIHELRQPLTGTKAGLRLLANALGERLTALDEWDLVVTQLGRMEEIFDAYQQVLGKAAPVPRPFEAAPVVLRALELLRFRTARLGARFTVSNPPSLPPALGSASALLHATTNVVVNALDAVEGKADRARVGVRLLTSVDAPGWLQVRVSDTGCGIPEALRERIFEPLFTTKASAGTGLGLHAARRMLRASGAAVRLLPENAPLREPWATTEFSIELPVATWEAG